MGQWRRQNISNISYGFIRNGLGFATWPNSGSENNCVNNYWGRESNMSTPLVEVPANIHKNFKYFFCVSFVMGQTKVRTHLSSSVFSNVLISENLSVLK